MAYSGNMTFRAVEDMDIFTVVRMNYGQTPTDGIPLIEKASITVPVVGTIQQACKAGDLVSVKPVNTDGLIRAKYDFGLGATVGTALFLTDVGTVSDVQVGGGIYVGDSVVTVQEGETTILLDPATEVSLSQQYRADAIAIEDAGGYFIPTVANIEGALQEVAKSLERYIYFWISPHQFNYVLGTSEQTNLLDVGKYGGWCAPHGTSDPYPGLHMAPGTDIHYTSTPRMIEIDFAQATGNQYILRAQWPIPAFAATGAGANIRIYLWYSWFEAETVEQPIDFVSVKSNSGESLGTSALPLTGTEGAIQVHRIFNAQSVGHIGVHQLSIRTPIPLGESYNSIYIYGAYARYAISQF